MPVFDITDYIINNSSKDMQCWLEEHVGPYYGRGENGVLRIGSGWEISTSEEITDDDLTYITFLIDITDEAKATAFALTWM